MDLLSLKKIALQHILFGQVGKYASLLTVNLGQLKKILNFYLVQVCELYFKELRIFMASTELRQLLLLFQLPDPWTFFLNYLLKITIYSMYSIQGRSYTIVPITNLTKMSTWTKSYKEGKIKIILV